MPKKKIYKSNKGRNINKIKQFFKNLRDLLLADLGGIIKHMPQDQNKINKKLEDLKTTYGGNWMILPEISALTTADVGEKGVAFNPARGVLLRAFLNKQDGEIKLFPLMMFEEDKKQ